MSSRAHTLEMLAAKKMACEHARAQSYALLDRIYIDENEKESATHLAKKKLFLDAKRSVSVMGKQIRRIERRMHALACEVASPLLRDIR